MSISTIALNTGILGIYGYQLYKIYQEKPEGSNSHVALTVESNIDPVNSDPLLREIEKELKPLIGNKRLILRNARHGELNPKKALAQATLITTPTSKEVIVNPDFYKKDKEACKALVKWYVQGEAEAYDYLYNYLYTRLLVRIIGQVAAAALSVSENWSLLRTMGFSLFLRMISPTICDCFHKVPNNVVSKSSANELIAARRILKVFEDLYRSTSFFHIKEVEIADGIKKCMKIIDKDIEGRKVEIDVKQEEEKIQSLQNYLQPFINLELNSSI